MEIVYFVISFIIIALTGAVSYFLYRFIRAIEAYPMEYDMSGFQKAAKFLRKSARVRPLLQENILRAVFGAFNMLKTIHSLKKFFKPFV